MSKKDRKEIIRKAAIKVFAARGFHQTTTDKVAGEAGVAVGTIYNYFRHKVDLLEYIFQVEYQKRKALYEELKQQSLASTQKIRLIMEKHFAEVEKEPDLVKIILRERQHTRYGFKGRTGLKKFFAEIIEEGVKKGELRDVDPDIISMMLAGTIEAVMWKYFAGEERQSKEYKHLFTSVVEETMKIFHQGIVNK